MKKIIDKVLKVIDDYITSELIKNDDYINVYCDGRLTFIKR